MAAARHSEELADIPTAALLGDEKADLFRPRRASWRGRIYFVVQLALAFFAGSLFTLLLPRIREVPQPLSRIPSIFDEADHGTHKTVQFNTSDVTPSDFIGKPRPELEAAWARVEKYNVFTVSKDAILAAGNGPDGIRLPAAVRQPGSGEYMATAEFIYHLHCLNFIRKSVFYNYEYYKDDRVFHDPVLASEVRLDHCIDVIRQVLMCKADTSITPYYWTKPHPIPYPNWNTWHQCSDFDALMSWTDDHAVPLPHSWDEWRQAVEDRVELDEYPEPDYHVLQS